MNQQRQQTSQKELNLLLFLSRDISWAMVAQFYQEKLVFFFKIILSG